MVRIADLLDILHYCSILHHAIEIYDLAVIKAPHLRYVRAKNSRRQRMLSNLCATDLPIR